MMTGSELAELSLDFLEGQVKNLRRMLRECSKRDRPLISSLLDNHVGELRRREQAKGSLLSADDLNEATEDD